MNWPASPGPAPWLKTKPEMNSTAAVGVGELANRRVAKRPRARGQAQREQPRLVALAVVEVPAPRAEVRLDRLRLEDRERVALEAQVGAVAEVAARAERTNSALTAASGCGAQPAALKFVSTPEAWRSTSMFLK